MNKKIMKKQKKEQNEKEKNNKKKKSRRREEGGGTILKKTENGKHRCQWLIQFISAFHKWLDYNTVDFLFSKAVF